MTAEIAKSILPWSSKNFRTNWSVCRVRCTPTPSPQNIYQIDFQYVHSSAICSLRVSAHVLSLTRATCWSRAAPTQGKVSLEVDGKIITTDSLDYRLQARGAYWRSLSLSLSLPLCCPLGDNQQNGHFFLFLFFTFLFCVMSCRVVSCRVMSFHFISFIHSCMHSCIQPFKHSFSHSFSQPFNH